jgi:hypothetical protein
MSDRRTIKQKWRCKGLDWELDLVERPKVRKTWLIVNKKLKCFLHISRL